MSGDTKQHRRTIKGLSMIWAMDRNGLIGQNNRMPWHLPAEFVYFRKVTTGHPVVMGRRTFESIGKPLPGRTNVVITRNPDYAPEGCMIVHSVEEAIDQYGGQPFFVIGGGQIYRAFLPYAEKLYVTVIEHEFIGDEYFPDIDWSQWRLVSEEQGTSDAKNPFDYSMRVYEVKE